MRILSATMDRRLGTLAESHLCSYLGNHNRDFVCVSAPSLAIISNMIIGAPVQKMATTDSMVNTRAKDYEDFPFRVSRYWTVGKSKAKKWKLVVSTVN